MSWKLGRSSRRWSTMSSSERMTRQFCSSGATHGNRAVSKNVASPTVDCRAIQRSNGGRTRSPKAMVPSTTFWRSVSVAATRPDGLSEASGAGELEQFLHRRPVPGGGGHAEVASGQLGPQLRARHSLGVPGIELATVGDEPLGRDRERRQLAYDLGIGLGGAEAHLVALGVLHDVAQRVSPNDLRELVARAHHHGDVEAEAVGDQALHLTSQPLGRPPAREDDVAALHVGADVLVAGVGEHLAEPGHRDAVARADVDAAQEDDLPHGSHSTWAYGEGGFPRAPRMLAACEAVPCAWRSSCSTASTSLTPSGRSRS